MKDMIREFPNYLNFSYPCVIVVKPKCCPRKLVPKGGCVFQITVFFLLTSKLPSLLNPTEYRII